MGIGIVTITKSLDNEEWSNNYAVIVADEEAAPLTVQDLPLIGVGATFSDETTDYEETGFLGDSWILAALLSFERRIHFSNVAFVKMDVTDGQKNTTVFASIPLSFYGQNTIAGGAEATIVPGNVALLVSKVPYAFSVRTGRSFYRAALKDEEVRFAGRGGIDWTTTALRANYQGYINGYVNDSSLSLYLGQGASVETQALAIPQYAPIGAENAGDLVWANPIASFTVLRPVSRQMKRGRKRPVSGV